MVEIAKNLVDLNELGYPSRTIGMGSDSYISSISRPRQRNSFEFIYGLEAPVWIALFVTILIIPLSFCVIEKSFSGYFKNMWNYSYLILSETIPKMPKCSMKRFVLTFWLLGCTVLLSGYSGVLRSLFLRPNPDDVIDSWKDLYDRKDMKILAMEGMALYHFAETQKDKNEMAREFASRLEPLKFGMYKELSLVAFKKLFSGYAVSYPKYLIEDCHHFSIRFFKDKSDLCKKVHISKYNSNPSPYSILISKKMTNNGTKALNNM